MLVEIRHFAYYHTCLHCDLFGGVKGASADDADLEAQPTAELLSRAVNVSDGSPTSELKIGAAESNLLSIVASQRERFRVRVHELEAVRHFCFLIAQIYVALFSKTSNNNSNWANCNSSSTSRGRIM